MAKLVIETELDTKQFDRQIDKVKNELDEIDTELSKAKELKLNSQYIEELKDRAEKLNNKLVDLNKQKEKWNQEQFSGEGFERGLKSLKRFALGLFGIQSAFSLVRRATSTYLSQNEATANKMNAIWTALGNALGPVIEIIANGVLKLIGYLQVFLNALGWKVDLTKNMNKSTKAIKGTTKAMKELNRQVASFDEANIMQKNTTTSGGASTDTGAFAMPELNQNIVNILETMARLLKENWDWIWKVGLALAGVFALSKLSGVIGGLDGLLGVLKPLAALGTIVVGVSILYDQITGRNLYNDLKMIREELEKGAKPQQEHTQQTKAQAKADKELIETKQDEVKAYKKGSDEANRWFDYLRQGAEIAANDTRNLAKKIDAMSGLTYWYEAGSGKVDEYNRQLGINNETIRTNIQEMANMYTQNQLTTEQEAKFNEILKAVNGKLVDGTVIYDDLDSRVLTASKHIDEHTELVNALGRDTESSTKKQKTAWSNLMTDINKMKATPTVEFKADTTKVSEVFKTLAESTTDVSSRNVMLTTSKTLKWLGLARGGIINLPGRGVPLTNVVGGEATGGTEGVVPMNNEQSMSVLGEAIARYVQINLTNNTLLDGKVIAREQRKISDNTNFATNGRGI